MRYIEKLASIEPPKLVGALDWEAIRKEYALFLRQPFRLIKKLPVLVPKPDWPPLRRLELKALAIHMHSVTPGGIL